MRWVGSRCARACRDPVCVAACGARGLVELSLCTVCCRVIGKLCRVLDVLNVENKILLQSLTENANVIDAKAEKHRADTPRRGTGRARGGRTRIALLLTVARVAVLVPRPGAPPAPRRRDTVPLVVVPLRSGRTWR